MDHSNTTHGYDARRENRPGDPMRSGSPAAAGAPQGQPPRQDNQPEREVSPNRELTPVYGTAQPTRGLSGAMRRAAYRIPEHVGSRWMLLMAADRVDVLEHRFPELARGEGWDELGRKLLKNPMWSVALGMGAVFLLSRSGAVGGVKNLFGGGEDDHSPDEERLITWLNNAYALEMAQIPVLKHHAEDARPHPWIRRKDLEHLEQTERHAELVKGCIERLGGKVSAGKAAVGRASGVMNAFATEPFEDEIVRNFLAAAATEELEIASYTAIITAARRVGDLETARVCKEILREEEQMAAWLERHLPRTVRETVGVSA
jgi:ferritin-like metal-binding protein YciE